MDPPTTRVRVKKTSIHLGSGGNLTDLVLSFLIRTEQDADRELLDLLAGVPNAPKAYWDTLIEETVCTNN